MFQEIPGACARYALHHLQKLREDARQKTLYLIRQGRMAPGASFPGLAEPAKFGSRPLGDHHRKESAHRDDVGNNFRVLLIRLVRRIVRNFLEPLRMKGIYLHQFCSARPHEMRQGFGIGPVDSYPKIMPSRL